MPPTPLAITLTCTSSVDSLFSASRSASALPCTSALISTGMTPAFASPICENTSLGARRGLLRELDVAELALAVQRHFARLALALDRQQLVAGVRRARQAQHHHRHRRQRLGRPAVPVSSNMARTRPNSLPARIGSPSFSVPRLTSTVATAPRPFSMLDSITTPEARPVARRLQLQHLGLQQDRLEQLVDALRRSCAETLTNMFWPPHSSGMTSCLDSSCAHALRVGVGLVDLVDRHDDRHAGGARMLDRLDGLRHHAVIGRHHQHHDVGGLGAAGAHRGERRVARRIQEGDHALGRLHVVGADVLGDAAGLARRDLGAADVVEQRGLAVVDVAHDGDHRRARRRLLGRVRHRRPAGPPRSGLPCSSLGRVAHLLDHQHRRVLVDRLVDGGHHAHVHQRLDDFGGLDGHLLRQLRHVMVSPTLTSRFTGAVGISKPCFWSRHPTAHGARARASSS